MLSCLTWGNGLDCGLAELDTVSAERCELARARGRERGGQVEPSAGGALVRFASVSSANSAQPVR